MKGQSLSADLRPVNTGMLQEKANPMYLLDFHATMTLFSGYDAKRRAMVIDRWIKLETGQAEPAMTKKAMCPDHT